MKRNFAIFGLLLLTAAAWLLLKAKDLPSISVAKTGKPPAEQKSLEERPETQKLLSSDAQTHHERDTAAASFLDKVSALVQKPDPFSEDSWAEIQPFFESQIVPNETAFQDVLASYRASPSSKAGQMLTILFGLQQDARVYRIAVAITESEKKADRLVGLDLINRLGTPTDEMQAIALKILEEENDPEVLSAAFFALQPDNDNPMERERIAAVASKHASNPNTELKRRALHALAKVMDDTDGFAVLQKGLLDKDNVVKATALQGIAQNVRFVETSTVDKVLDLLEQQKSDPYLQEIGQRALSQWKLTSVQTSRFRKIVQGSN